MARGVHLPKLVPPDEQVKISYRQTDQELSVCLSAYLAHRHTKYRNWQLCGQAEFLAPPICLSQFISASTKRAEQ